MATVAAQGPAARSADQSAILRGLGLCTIAMILLPGQDIIAKYISGTVSAGALSWFRFLLQSLFTLPVHPLFSGRARSRPEPALDERAARRAGRHEQHALLRRDHASCRSPMRLRSSSSSLSSSPSSPLSSRRSMWAGGGGRQSRSASSACSSLCSRAGRSSGRSRLFRRWAERVFAVYVLLNRRHDRFRHAGSPCNSQPGSPRSSS